MHYEREIKTAIDLISISVRTAPKSGGIDDIIFRVLSKKEINKIVQEMIKIGQANANTAPNKKVKDAILTSWSSDAKTVKDSDGVVLIGVHGKKALGFNCGACGLKSCAEFYKHINKNPNLWGPFCMFKVCDLGIAVSSAAKTASMLNVDNRIMYRIGVAVEKAKILKRKSSKVTEIVTPIMGLPLSVSGKNIYFDRLDKIQAGQVLKDYFLGKNKK